MTSDTNQIDYVFLTRFNLPSEGYESIVRAKEGWLRQRIVLFERYCVPSIQAQTDQEFHWIIYFDPESPEWLKQRIQDHVDQKIYVPFFRTSVSTDEAVADIRSVTGGRGRRLITSNLDNDDGLAVDFVERLKNAVPQAHRAAIYLTHGLIKSQSHLYLRTDRTNAFASVTEDWESPSTCWSDWHNLLGKSMPTVEVGRAPGWLQVVHNGNVSNRVRGRLVSPSRYTQLFPGLLDDASKPKLSELAIDMFAAQPRRFVRDSARTLAKTIAMRLIGKSSLDQAKQFWASKKRALKANSR